MHDIGMAIDAGGETLAQQGVGLTPFVARRHNCVRVMTAAAGDAVLVVHLGANFRLELDPERLPGFGIAEIMCQFDERVLRAEVTLV